MNYMPSHAHHDANVGTYWYVPACTMYIHDDSLIHKANKNYLRNTNNFKVICKTKMIFNHSKWKVARLAGTVAMPCSLCSRIQLDWSNGYSQQSASEETQTKGKNPKRKSTRRKNLPVWEKHSASQRNIWFRQRVPLDQGSLDPARPCGWPNLNSPRTGEACRADWLCNTAHVQSIIDSSWAQTHAFIEPIIIINVDKHRKISTIDKTNVERIWYIMVLNIIVFLLYLIKWIHMEKDIIINQDYTMLNLQITCQWEVTDSITIIWLNSAKNIIWAHMMALNMKLCLHWLFQLIIIMNPLNIAIELLIIMM